MSQGTTSSRMHDNPDDYWTDTHESEVKFQRRKQNNELTVLAKAADVHRLISNLADVDK